MIEITETAANADAAQLDREIRDLAIANFEGVRVEGDQATALFSVAPSAGDETAVRNALLNHVPSTDLEVRIHDFLDNHRGSILEPPKDVDYITSLNGRLNPTNSVVVQGEIQQVKYYATANTDPVTGKITGYADLVVQEDFVYDRDPDGMAVKRTQTISWARRDGSLHPDTKTRVKHYEDFESLIEGQRRRRLLADKMAMTLTGWLIATQTQLVTNQERMQLGRDFLADHKTMFDLFIEVSEKQVVYDVRNDADPNNSWLDEYFDQPTNSITVRDWIDTQINIWGLP